MHNQCYEILQSGQIKVVNHKYNVWNCGSWPEIKNLGRFGLKVASCPIFIKFDFQNKSNMLIVSILIGSDDLDPKLQICEIWSQNWSVLQFSWNLALEQIEHANYELMMILLGIDDLDPKLSICVNLVPKLKWAPIFMKFGTQDILKILLNKVTNLVKGLRNVKTLKSLFFRVVHCGTPCPVKHIMSFCRKHV